MTRLPLARPSLEKEMEDEDAEKDSESLDVINRQNNANETTERKFSMSGLTEIRDNDHPTFNIAASTRSPRLSPQPIQIVSPIVKNSLSAITFSTDVSASPQNTPNCQCRYPFKSDDSKDSVMDNTPRRVSDKGLLRRKSLKSTRRHSRDTKSVILKEEEEEEEEIDIHQVDFPMNQHLTTTTNHAAAPVDWINSKEAREGFFQYATFLYALLAIFYLIVEEATDENCKDCFPARIIFHFFMYGVAITFIAYVNVFVIHPPWFNRILYCLSDRGWWNNAEKHIIMPATHNAEPVSTLYLRMGTLLFGCAGIVLYGLELYMLFSGKAFTSFVSLAVAENLMGVAFTFAQMYFMNVNYKLLVKTSRNVCRFGFMHCFALNLCIWHRFAAAKANKSKKKLVKKEQSESLSSSSVEDDISSEGFNKQSRSNSSSSSSSEEWIYSNGSNRIGDSLEEVLTRVTHYLTTTLSPDPDTANNSSAIKTTAITNTTMSAFENTMKNDVTSLEYFGNFAGFLNTCLIEYSLIGAAVMFVFWTHLDPSAPQHIHAKKRGVRVDFTNSQTGLYLGAILFILGAVSCGVYAALYADHNPNAYLMFGIYELVCCVCSIIAVIAEIIFMRSLVLSGHRHGEDVDFLLLYIAFCGEVIWCSAEVARFIDVGGDGFIFVVTLVRLAHVFSQTWFILMACKLELAPSSTISAMRGRQCVTFLLVTNVTLFFFHIYESMTEGFGYVSSSSSNHTYVKLLAGPIIAFYRFHCSVCLAEVWKKTFSRPKERSHHSDRDATSTTTPPPHVHSSIEQFHIGNNHV